MNASEQLHRATWQRCPRALVLAAATLWLAAPAGAQAAHDAARSSARRSVASRGAEVLFWSQAQKEAGFPRMDSIYPARVVRAGGRVRALRTGAPIAAIAPGGALAAAVDSFIVAQRVAGLLILHDGAIRLERYALGHAPGRRWTSFSVAKSVTSTLVGAAIRDGFMRGLDDSLVRYLPELGGSAYDGVTVRHLLTMTSGVAFNEDYADPRSDIARLYAVLPDSGLDNTLSYARGLRREAAPGSKWLYKTIETNLVGNLVMAATGKPLADYLSEKVWRPAGMEHDASWLVDETGREQGGCCLQASLRDFARFGLFMLDGARVDGTAIVPDDWVALATSTRADIGVPGAGYGYQWWTSDDGTYHARGIFGQLIHVDPARRLVVVLSSAWPVATGRAQAQARARFLETVTSALDAER